MKINWIEVMGVVATLFVFIGFTQSNATRIRILNSVGSFLFIIYGVLLGALSVWLLNGACLLLNIYKIIKESRQERYRNAKTVSSGIVIDNEGANKMTKTADIAKVGRLRNK